MLLPSLCTANLRLYLSVVVCARESNLQLVTTEFISLSTKKLIIMYVHAINKYKFKGILFNGVAKCAIFI